MAVEPDSFNNYDIAGAGFGSKDRPKYGVPGDKPKLFHHEARFNAPAGSSSGAGRSPDEEKRLIEMGLLGMFGGSGREGGAPSELLYSIETDELKTGVRQLIGIAAENIVLNEEPPHAYAIEESARVLKEGAKGIINLKCGIGSPSEKLKAIFGDENKTENLYKTRLEMAEEIIAAKNMLEALKEVLKYGDDEEKILFERFVSPGKQRVFAEFFGNLFKAKESRNGGLPFGETIQESLNVFKEVAEGKCVIELTREDGYKLMGVKFKKREIEVEEKGKKTIKEVDVCDVDEQGDLILEQVDKLKGTVANIYAIPFNRGLFELILRKKIVEPKTKGKNTWEKLFIENEAKTAAYMAYAISRVIGFGPKYSLGTSGVGTSLDAADITAEDLRLMTLGTDKGSSDSKLNIEVRRAAELAALNIDSKTGKLVLGREHMRPAGSPLSVGCYPSMVATAFESMRIEVEARNISTGRNKQISLSVAEAVWGSRDVTTPKGIYKINAIKLSDIKWGDISFFVQGLEVGDYIENENLRIVRKLGPAGEALVGKGGVDSDAHESTYQLLRFYAFRFFKEVTRVDFLKQAEDVLGVEKLISLNKTIDVALGLLCGAYNIPKETTEKLNNYIRVVYLANVAEMVTLNPINTKLKRSLAGKAKGGVDYKLTVDSIKEAATTATFFPNTESEGFAKRTEWADNLYTKITKERVAITPFELIEGSATAKEIGFFFTKEELRMLSPLYPLYQNQEVLK